MKFRRHLSNEVYRWSTTQRVLRHTSLYRQRFGVCKHFCGYATFRLIAPAHSPAAASSHINVWLYALASRPWK